MPCSACSWTVDRQNACQYHSRVKLFYSCHTRGVWSLGSRYVLKDRSDTPRNLDTQNLPFLRATTTIPVPLILDEWREPDDVHMMILSRVEGETLKEAWPNLSEPERQRIASQTADYLGQLRGLQSDRLQSLGSAPLFLRISLHWSRLRDAPRPLRLGRRTLGRNGAGPAASFRRRASGSAAAHATCHALYIYARRS